MEVIYNKLVRDKIPEIIEQDHRRCEIEIVTDAECQKLLKQKLTEEVEEYLLSGDIEELVDVLEVIHGIVQWAGMDFQELEIMRKGKLEEKGGFEKKVKLLRVTEQ